ncbi:MAG TPA: succinyl-diaminopimelate desuccinylase [Gammaproteobacteria bacterium]|nr:succinyl-diaminopimelate desuccinylase [Gammaproteobacteria bacterium]
MNGSDAVVELACELIRRRSLTPADGGCQELLGERLAPVGFALESMPFGEVSNLWATQGNGAPLLVLAGHSDVVPPGPLENWTSDPFEPVLREGRLYGRGAADMKGGLAALVVAAINFVRVHPRHSGTLAFLITSDEEGPARDGTRRVAEALLARGLKIDHCLIAEPSAVARAGDEIRIGRRGSLTAELMVSGVQGHVAYPDQADNAAHRLLGALGDLRSQTWGKGDPAFPPLSFQIANLAAGTGADNVIPGEARARFNFRYPPPFTAAELKRCAQEVVARQAPRHALHWQEGGHPFLSRDGALRAAVVAAIEAVTGTRPALGTGGGTSDGRFLAPLGIEVVELGPVRESIHKADESVALSDLASLVAIYGSVLERVLAPSVRRSS